MILSKAPLLSCALALWITIPAALAGDLTKNYFGATKPGGWSEYLLTSPDGSKSSFSYERQADERGRPILELMVKILAGPGKDSKSKNRYFLPPTFDFEKEGLNYGRFAEKMTMDYGGAEMTVDDKTLEMIRQGTKDFRGALTFEAAEKMEGRTCDRYSYAMKIGGPNPTQEAGKLWLSAEVPFAIVRQTARVTDAAGKPVTEFDMRLTNIGVNQALAVAPPPPPEMKKPAPPSETTLAEGFKTGRVGMELEAVPGTAGKQLRLSLVNKTEEKLTVNVPAGEMQFEVDSPVNTLRIAGTKAARVSLASGEKTGPMLVEQHGKRGVVEGHCALSVYEGRPLFSGSVTMGNLTK